MRGGYHRDQILRRVRTRRHRTRMRIRINQAARGHLRGHLGMTTQEARASLWTFVEMGGRHVWKKVRPS